MSLAAQSKHSRIPPRETQVERLGPYSAGSLPCWVVFPKLFPIAAVCLGKRSIHLRLIFIPKPVRIFSLSLLLIASLFPLTVFSQSQWEVTSSTVTFAIRNAGIEVDGQLGGFSGTISFSPEELSASRMYASLETSTIDTGIGARDASLRDEEYFDAASYPRITMKSTSFRKSGDRFIGVFTLKIKGVSKQIEMPFRFEEANGQATFTGSFEINRLDFGVGESSWLMSDDVTISIKVTGTKA